MAFIGKKPTAAPLTSSDVADDIITLAKMAGGTDGNIITYDASGNPAVVATGSDGQVLTSTGAGSPPAFEAAGGNPTLLYSAASTTDIGSLDVSNTYITSTHRWYRIYLSGKVKTDNVVLRSRFTIDASAVTAGYAARTQAYGGSDYNNSTSAAYIALDEQFGIGNAANEPFSAVIEFLNPTSTTLCTHLHWGLSYAQNADSFHGDNGIARRNDGTQAHNGIDFYLSSGDFEEYAIAVFGFKV